MTVRILLVEDVPADAELAERELRRAQLDFELHRVDSREDFAQALRDFKPDLVLSDHNLPSFSGRDALHLTRELGLDIPVILLTGSLNEETAVEYMKAGASDYVLKDRPTRLGPAVQGALERQREREAKRRAEQARRETEERLTIVVQATNDAVWDWDVTANTVWVNEGFWQMFGYRPEAAGSVEQWWDDRIHPDDHRRVTNSFRAFLASDEPLWSGEYRFRRADGSYANIFNRGRALRDAAGRMIRMIGAMMDVSRLVSAEQKYRSIFDTAPFGICQTTLDGRILTANPTLARMLGYDASEDLLGLDLARHVYRHAEERDQTFRRSVGSTRIVEVEVEWLRRDGSPIWVHVSIRPVVDGAGKIRYFEEFVRDITQNKLLEEQLRQSQKMDAVGQLAGGVAHDFNNVLTAIIGYADLLSLDLDPQDRRHSDVEEIRQSAERAASLTRQLLAFSRRQVLEARVLALNEIVAGMDKMLRRLIGEHINLLTVLAPTLGMVRADSGQIEQVIMNLVVNARDAMPEGGKITLQTADVTLDESYSNRHVGVAPGRYVMLAVSDTGMGMTEQVKARLFEPFFTTKGPGKGTGLGLSTVYGIVKQSGGNIWVYSEPGHGATFKVYLPRVDAPPSARVAAPTPRDLRGNETILLAEDAESVRSLAHRVLTGYGYTVLDARGGSEALKIAAQHHGPIHLLLSDIIMPEMSGRDLARRLVTVRPELRVLYMSGYTDEAIVHHGVLEQGVAYIQKPFTTERLASRVREVLDAETESKPAP